nr:hypothetical protein [Tanacetum cinerariifolium]
MGNLHGINNAIKVTLFDVIWPGERKVYVRILPLCNKCKMHHIWLCIAKCGSCKGIGYMTRDYRSPITASSQRALAENKRTTITCYECGKHRHFKSECLKLKNQNHGNQVRNKEAQERAYALRGGEANQDSNVVMGTFLLNNHYASILFDSGVDRSFVSTTFSSLIDIIPTCKNPNFRSLLF